MSEMSQFGKINPFATGDFAKKHILKLVEWFSGHRGAIREIKILVYAKRQSSDSSWDFLRIENKQIKTVQNNSYE